MRARSLVPIVIVSFVLRAAVAFVLFRDVSMTGDAQDYVERAAELAFGPSSASAHYWPPGWPLVLAGAFRALGDGVAVARVVVVLLGVAGVVLTALLARDLAPNGGAAKRAGWIGALYAPAVLLSGQAHSQHLAAVCLAAVAFFGARAIRTGRLAWSVALGAAFGLGCLTRPSMVSLAPVLFVAWLLAMRAAPRAFAPLVRSGALAAAIACAFVAPVVLHNARAGAGYTISTNNERNFFLGNNPFTPDYKTSHLGQRSLDQLDAPTRSYLESFYARPDARAAMRDEALRYVVRHPLVTAYRTFNRATSFWGFDYFASRVLEEATGKPMRAVLPLLALEASSYVAVMALALVALFAMKASCDTWTRAWLVALALAYEAPYTIAFSGGTYHFPVMPLVIPFAGVALEGGVPAAARRAFASRAALIALAFLAIVQIEYAYYAIKMA